MRLNEARIGLIVPSSNTNAEPLAADMLRGMNAVAMASRFPLPSDLGAVIDEDLLGPAADLIADSGVACQGFHGTSGCWLGFEHDRALADRLQSRTGILATTASLATVQGIEAVSAKRVGLVFPGPVAVAEQIEGEFRNIGIEVLIRSLPAASLNNQQISRLSRSELESLIAGAVAPGIEAVVCIGTNLRSAYLVADLESQLGVPIIDSAAAIVWQLLAMAGVQERLQGWGRLASLSPTM
jgi:maleate isomerase